MKKISLFHLLSFWDTVIFRVPSPCPPNKFLMSYWILLSPYRPFLWMWFNCLKACATSRRQFTFYYQVPRSPWYSFYQPRKDERLSWPWRHPVVLNTRPLDWESSALTNSPETRLAIPIFDHAWLKNIQSNFHFRKFLSIC